MRTALILFALLLAGCVSSRTLLINKQGEKITCDSGGWGIVGGLMADGTRGRCVRQAREQGYQILEEN